MNKIVKNGTKIPTLQSRNYTTTYDYQEKMKISIYQGEEKYVKDNLLLGEFTIDGLPKKLKGEVDVKVKFFMDGILNVEAFEKSNSISKSIQIINDKLIVDNDKINTINYKGKILGYINDYYEYKNEDKEDEKKNEILYNLSENLINFIKTFEFKENITFERKYFFYVKLLFESYKYRILLHIDFEKEEIDNIIENSKYFLKNIVSFKSTNYKSYNKLLSSFVDEKNDILLKRILFELIMFIMNLLIGKSKTILEAKNNYSFYKSKCLLKDCLKFQEFENKIKNSVRYGKYKKRIEECNESIKKIDLNNLLEIYNIKNSSKLFENKEDLKKEELLLLLDNYRDILYNKTIEHIDKAIILANIFKIKYKYLQSNAKLDSIYRSIELELSKISDFYQKSDWYLEYKQLLNERKKQGKEEIKNILDEEEEEEKKIKNKLENYEKKIKKDYLIINNFKEEDEIYCH